MEHPSANFRFSFFYFPCHSVWPSISPHMCSTGMFLSSINKGTGDSLMFHSGVAQNPIFWDSASQD